MAAPPCPFQPSAAIILGHYAAFCASQLRGNATHDNDDAADHYYARCQILLSPFMYRAAFLQPPPASADYRHAAAAARHAAAHAFSPEMPQLAVRKKSKATPTTSGTSPRPRGRDGNTHTSFLPSPRAVDTAEEHEKMTPRVLSQPALT